MLLMFPLSPNTAFTRYAIQALNEIGEAALILPVHVFGEVNFPAQPVIKGQLGSHAEGVLSVIEHAVLTFRGIQAGADIAAHLGYIAEQEGAEVQDLRLPASEVVR